MREALPSGFTIKNPATVLEHLANAAVRTARSAAGPIWRAAETTWGASYRLFFAVGQSRLR